MAFQYHAGERLRLCAQLPASGLPAVLSDGPLHHDTVKAKLVETTLFSQNTESLGPGRECSNSDEVGDTMASEGKGSGVGGLSVPPGLPPPHGLPSHGSLLHGTSRCRPCMWFWKESGCMQGQDCWHCHLCPQNEGALRRRKRRVQKRKCESEVGPITKVNEGSTLPASFSCLEDSSTSAMWSPECLPIPSGSDCDSSTKCDSDEESLSSCGARSLSSNSPPSSPRMFRMGSPPGVFLQSRR